MNKKKKRKAHRAFYAIKQHIPVELPIRIWLKLFEAIIEPIALQGREVWGPLNQEFGKWDKNPIETLHAEFLTLHRNTTNNACRAELGQFPLLIKIQKRAIKFWEHLKQSDPHSYQYKALQHQELSKANSPLTQLALNLSSYTLTHTNTSLVQGQNKNTKLIRINQIATQLKQNYMTHWESQTKSQSKNKCYLALKRQYTVANYLTTVTDTKLRSTLTEVQTQ